MLLMGVSALAAAILRCARLFLIQQALCRAYYSVTQPSLIAPDGSVDETLCKSDEIQADLAMVSGLFEIITQLSGEVLQLLTPLPSPPYPSPLPFPKREVTQISGALRNIMCDKLFPGR